MAGWMAVLGSLFALVSVYDHVASLRSLDTRRAVEQSLSEPPLNGLGIGVEQVLDVMHVLALLTGACAVAALVLGWHVLRGHRGARLALSVLAVPLLLAGMGSGGFFTTLVAVSVVLLWSQDARAWFDGTPPPSRSQQLREPEPPRSPYATPHAYAAPTVTPTARTQRPGALLAAAVLTWVFAALSAVMMVVAAVLAAGDAEQLLAEVREAEPAMVDPSVTPDLLVAAMTMSAVIVVAFCVAASLMAGFALAGKAWARTTWLVLIIIVAVVLAVGAVTSALLAVPMLAAVLTLALLLRPEVRSWFASR